MALLPERQEINLWPDLAWQIFYYTVVTCGSLLIGDTDLNRSKSNLTLT